MQHKAAKMLYNPLDQTQPRKRFSTTLEDMSTFSRDHNRCGSTVFRTINAPLPLIWSIIRQFDNPKAYNRFVKGCTMVVGDGGIGSVRELMHITGLPFETITERLDKLDDDSYVMMVSTIGGDNRLVNYKSTTTLNEVREGKGCNKTLVTESYVVDVPTDSCEEDTCLFADTLIGFNLKSLAIVSERKASQF